jgi:hypothetical protein
MKGGPKGEKGGGDEFLHTPEFWEINNYISSFISKQRLQKRQ